MPTESSPMYTLPSRENQDAIDISSQYKNNKSSLFEAASVPHTRVELVIYCVRGSCPGPLDECGIIRRFLFWNRVQKYNFFSIWQTFCNIFLTSQLLSVILQHIAMFKLFQFHLFHMRSFATTTLIQLKYWPHKTLPNTSFLSFITTYHWL